MKNNSVHVIGGGPAGLTAAYLAAKAGFPTTVLEKTSQVGGISRTEVFNGFRFDIGGHRFYTKDPQIQDLWASMLGEDLLIVDRLSRIYYQGQFLSYPIEVMDVLQKLGLVEILQIFWSYLAAKLHPRVGSSYEDWMINRFGARLYRKFFQSYTEKVWGIPGQKIQADWASQRIQGLSLRSMVLNLIRPQTPAKSLIARFSYPVSGSGMMWERFLEEIQDQGGVVNLNSEVKSVLREGNHLTGLEIQSGLNLLTAEVDQLISSMPTADLINSLKPQAPPEVLDAANRLRYRDYILVGLILDRASLFPDQWLYIHEPEVKAGRIQNFKNWSPRMVPDPGKSTLGIEYFCTRGDDLWQMEEGHLIDLAVQEMIHLKLINQTDVAGGIVIRQPKAYPIYDENYHHSMALIRAFLDGFDNLQVIGRNGMHRYNNMDHSMLTAMLAVRNLEGGGHDLWQVNTDQEYGEIVQ